ncbi:MAG: hypothetical protein J6C44_07990 [Muribaculaceae bacterium]|nr:hypothetical protein [Muribaculaceae bacterium]
MKKLILALAIIMSAATVLPVSVNADNVAKEQKQNRKDAQKNAKKRAKKLKKEGWQVQGSLDDEIALTKHCQKLAEFGGNGTEVIGEVMGKKKVRVAVSEARAEAVRKYAEEQHMAVKGKITDAVGDMSEVEIENFMNAFTALYTTEIKGELQQSLQYVRERNGLYDVQVFFVVDIDKANSAAVRALKQTAEKQKLAIEVARSIEEWINDDSSN